jgi:hypothetical protein
MKRLIASATTVAALALGVSAHATQFVTNGDFTDLSNGLGQLTTNTVATGWSVPSGGYTFIFTQGDIPSEGQYGGLALWDANNISVAHGAVNTWNGLTASGVGNFAAIDGDFQDQPLQQTISGLTIGKAYSLTYNYAFGQQLGFFGPTNQSLTVTLGSDYNSTTSPVYPLPGEGFSGWFTGGSRNDFIATATTETLSFVANGDVAVPPFALVSDVSITGVPEPTTWAMMILGLGGLGALARRRRAVAHVAA